MARAKNNPIAGAIVSRQKIGSGVVKSAGRVLQILEFFDDVQRPASVAEVSESLNYPQSSTSALLRSLVNLGYLNYDPHARTYISSTRVALLGNWLGPQYVAEGSVVQMMRELNEKTGDTVFLGVRNGLHVQYIHVVQAQSPARLHLTLGTVRPLARSGAGLAILSTMQDQDVIRLVNRINAEADSEIEKVKVRDVLETLAEVRSKGYALSANTITPGGATVVMPLPTRAGEPLLVIGIGGVTEVILHNLEGHVALMFDAINRYLGRDIRPR